MCPQPHCCCCWSPVTYPAPLSSARPPRKALAFRPVQLLLSQAPSSLPFLLLPALYSLTAAPGGLLLSSLPSSGNRQEIQDLRKREGRRGPRRPVGLGETVDLKSVTSALIRASRALCSPAAAAILCRSVLWLLCVQKRAAPQNLDSPSAKAGDGCFFIDLCPPMGPCLMRYGDFRDPERGRGRRTTSLSAQWQAVLSFVPPLLPPGAVADQCLPPSQLGRQSSPFPSLHALQGQSGPATDPSPPRHSLLVVRGHVFL